MNTAPSTPFGKLFAKWGIWQPKFNGAIEDIYDKLRDAEKAAIQDASGWIAVINANLDKTPDEVFTIIQKVFPTVTKEGFADTLNDVNKLLLKAESDTPATLEDGIKLLQDYLSGFEGNVWAVVTKAVVTVLADVLLKGSSPIQTIETVLEYVYQTFIKGKV